MPPPSRRLAPGAGTARPPHLGRQGAGPGDQRAPPTPPPLPLRPTSGQRQTEETAAPHPPRRSRCTRRERAPRPRQAPPLNHLHAPALPAADRRRTGGAQDGANRAAPSEAGLVKGGARTRAGGFPPLPPPPRRTDPLAADRAAPDAHGRPATPTARVYPGGARQRQRRAGRRPTGRGGGGRRSGPPSPPPPPAPPLQPEGHRSDPPPPRSRGDAPPPPDGTATRGGGGCGWTCTPRAPAPKAACSRGGRGRRASPQQRAEAARGPNPGGGAGRRTRTVWRPRQGCKRRRINTRNVYIRVPYRENTIQYASAGGAVDWRQTRVPPQRMRLKTNKTRDFHVSAGRRHFGCTKILTVDPRHIALK